MKKALFLFTAIILLFISFNVALAEKDLFEGMLTYNESQYYVGFDMQPGEYVLLATGNSKAYFSISSDANSNRIICNDNFEINRIITVYTNDYVTLKRCIAIKAEDFYQQYTIKTDKPGIMLRVGYDIMPGTYKIQQVSTTSSSAYYCIYTSSRQDKIVSNDNFTGSRYVTVTKATPHKAAHGSIEHQDMV